MLQPGRATEIKKRRKRFVFMRSSGANRCCVSSDLPLRVFHHGRSRFCGSLLNAKTGNEKGQAGEQILEACEGRQTVGNSNLIGGRAAPANDLSSRRR